MRDMLALGDRDKDPELFERHAFILQPVASCWRCRDSLRASAAVPAEDLGSNERAQYLRRAATDGEHAHVACHALDREIVGIATRTVKLQRVVDDLDRGFGGIDFGLRRKFRVGEGAAVRTLRARGGKASAAKR